MLYVKCISMKLEKIQQYMKRIICQRRPLGIAPRMMDYLLWFFSCSVVFDSSSPWTTAYSTPGFPVFHCLLEFDQIHVNESVMLSNHLIFCFPLLLLPSVFPGISVFSSESALWLGGQSIGASASATDLLMNIQVDFRIEWFDLLTV